MVDGMALSTHLQNLSGVGQLGSKMELPIAPPRPGGIDEPQGKSFSDVLAESIEKVNTRMNDSDKAIDDMATGRSQDVHHTLIAMQKADISFRMMLEVRNKVMKAYDDISRMQA